MKDVEARLNCGDEDGTIKVTVEVQISHIAQLSYRDTQCLEEAYPIA